MGNLPDQHARALRLVDLMEECHRLDMECLVAVDPEVIVEGDWPAVPYRYVGVQSNGSATWLLFDNDLVKLRQTLEDEILDDDHPWVPGDVVDLDTGHRWGSFVKVTLKPYTHKVSWSYVVLGDTRQKSFVRVHSLEEADAMERRLLDSGGTQDNVNIEEIDYAGKAA